MKENNLKPRASQRRLDRIVMRFRLAVVRAVCLALLPRDVWAGKHLGAYTCRWAIQLGKLDSRGVLQAISDHDIVA